MITSRDASTTSWSEIPGLTVTFLQEDGLFVISRSSVLSSLVKGVKEISMEVVVGSAWLYCGLRPFDSRIVKVSSDVG